MAIPMPASGTSCQNPVLSWNSISGLIGTKSHGCSPGYCALPILERPLLPADRFSERIDQGERQLNFWINAGAASERTAAIEREALAHNETPFALSFFPSGEGRTNPPLIAAKPAVPANIPGNAGLD